MLQRPYPETGSAHESFLARHLPPCFWRFGNSWFSYGFPISFCFGSNRALLMLQVGPQFGDWIPHECFRARHLSFGIWRACRLRFLCILMSLVLMTGSSSLVHRFVRSQFGRACGSHVRRFGLVIVHLARLFAFDFNIALCHSTVPVVCLLCSCLCSRCSCVGVYHSCELVCRVGCSVLGLYTCLLKVSLSSPVAVLLLLMSRPRWSCPRVLSSSRTVRVQRVHFFRSCPSRER